MQDVEEEDVDEAEEAASSFWPGFQRGGPICAAKASEAEKEAEEAPGNCCMQPLETTSATLTTSEASLNSCMWMSQGGVVSWL